jgi:hypothetical protein
MTRSPLLVESGSDDLRYTHLFACISEEDDGYVIQIRLYNQTSPENAAWGEEITDSFERASMLIAALASEFSIPTASIKIEIRMADLRSGTQH